MRGQDPNNLIWVDLEMTGLDVASKTIIEIAIVITDKELKELGRWPQGETGPGYLSTGRCIGEGRFLGQEEP